MLPGGVVAATFLLSLVPGWWFLRRTESSRRPRQLSSLQELLELVGVGLATTGLAACAIVLIWPDLVLDLPRPTTVRDLRMSVLVALGLLAAAIGLVEFAAAVVRHRSPSQSARFEVGSWWSVLRPDNVPDGALPFVAVERTDGVTFQGVLHDYTWSPDVAHRDIALKAPIKFTVNEQSKRRFGPATTTPVTKSSPLVFVVIPGSQIAHIAVMYPRNGGDKKR